MDAGKEREVSGEELYALFLAGDSNSFEELVALYEDELASFLYGILKDYREAKHLTIDTFAQLAINGKQFSGRSSLKTYLFTIGKNLAARYLKKRGREHHLSLEEAERALLDEHKTPADHIEREESKKLLHEAVQELSEDYRTVIILLYFQEMSYLEAGRIMNKSVKQIGDLAYRAKAALKKKLADQELGQI